MSFRDPLLHSSKNYERIASRAFQEYGGLFVGRMAEYFSQRHYDIMTETVLGQQLMAKYEVIGEMITVLIWEMWKKSSNGKRYITDEDIQKELEVYFGDEILRGEIEICGMLEYKNFCDAIRAFLDSAKNYYYSGAIGRIIRCWERCKGRLFSKMRRAQDPSKDQYVQLTYID